ncbi:MAG: hypothetical protein QGF09_02955 [Rhodospirillales bacterium]|jgi:hypothetical protein|nr:hypothetical protein [Rhodospirillales bacterium]
MTPKDKIMGQDRFSGGLYLIIALFTLVDAFRPSTPLTNFTSVLILLFLALEIRRVSRVQLILGGFLGVAGLGGAALSGEWSAVVVDGLARSRPFLLLFFAVAWLQPPAMQSPALQATRGHIVNQPPGRRYMSLSLGVHGIGAVLNLAGLGLLATVIERTGDVRLRRRLAVALMQGFTTTSCWSPFTIGMVVVLVALPGLAWRQVALIGVATAATLILSGLVLDYLFHRGQPEPAGAPPPPMPAIHTWRTLGILISLAAMVLLLTESARISIPVALSIVGPAYGLSWYGLMTGHRAAWGRRAGEMAGNVITQLPSLRGEALVFVGANLFGLGVSSILPAQALGAAVDGMIPWPDVKLVATIALFLVCAMAGLHPVVVVIFFSAVLPPEALGLETHIMGATYLVVWGMSSMVSPFSATNLYMARLTGLPSHVIAWRWGVPSILPSAVAVAACLILIRHLGL